jgi:hypothetical protein
MTAVAVASAAAAAEAQPQASHPVVSDVVRMLDSKVQVSVILEWLGSVENPPTGLTADDMILLTRAGAPEPVILKILERAAGPSAATPPTTAPKATGSAAPSPPPTPAPASGNGAPPCCIVYFSILFRPTFDSDAGDRVGDLYVYLDGNFLGRAGVGKRNAVELGTSVGLGEHSVRLMVESHTRSGRDGAFEHEALVDPDVVRFTLDEPGDWKLELNWSEAPLSKGALSWTLSRDGKRVAGESGVGTDRARWPPLCEDIEASVPPGQGRTAWVQRQLSRCVKWNDLWPGVEKVPSREEARTPPAGT